METLTSLPDEETCLNTQISNQHVPLTTVTKCYSTDTLICSFYSFLLLLFAFIILFHSIKEIFDATFHVLHHKILTKVAISFSVNQIRWEYAT